MKAGFLGRVSVWLNPENRWVLEDSLIFRTTVVKPPHHIIVVPRGFVTDFASVPRFPGMYLFFGNTAHAAAVIHDWLYEQGIGTKAEADAVFLEAMEVSGVPLWRRWPMYLAVVAGGRGNFKGETE